MEVQVFYQILVGLIFLVACSLGYATSEIDPKNTMDIMQNDDYDYSDDQSMPNNQAKSPDASPTTGILPHFNENNITISTIVGKNLTLKCPIQNFSENIVVLWYKGPLVLTTGNLVLLKEYSIDFSDFSLKLQNVTDANQGEYYCEIQPGGLRFHTTLVVMEHPIENIIPESSKSSQESVHFKAATTLVASSVIGIFLFLRI